MPCVHRTISFLCAALAAFGFAALCKAAGDPASIAVQARPRSSLALLLPLDSADFAPPAEAVLEGCRAALALADPRPSLEVLRSDASVTRDLAAYEAAAQRGAAVIIGPMTRMGVSALAASDLVSVPTLALNTPEGVLALPARLFTFGLSAEAEARQVAREAFAERLHDAVVVAAATALAKRTSQAFADQWFALGGKISDVQEFSAATDLVPMRERLAHSGADLIFLAADPEQARRVRPYLNNQIQVFATSQINDGSADPLANLDLNGVRFVEMPWLAQPDNLTVMIYRRDDRLLPSLQRFYALGIDACRIALQLLDRRPSIRIEGVTGRLSGQGQSLIERELLPSVFRDGAGVALETR